VSGPESRVKRHGHVEAAHARRPEAGVTTQLAMVLGLLAASIAMFVMNRPRMDAVGLIMLTLLPLIGVITPGEALAGFSDPNIVLLGGLFVIGEALVRTGVAQGIGDWLIRTAGQSPTRLLVLLMAAVAGMGAFMSSTGVVAIFIPIALRIGQSTGTAPSRLMMPLSVAALISGMMTLVATAPNLVVNSELVRQGFAGFDFFSFTPFGAPVLVLGIVYMLFARRWLAAAGGAARGPARPAMSDWIERYDLAARERRLRVTERSPFVGKTIGDLDLRKVTGAHLVAVERRRGYVTDVIAPTRRTAFLAGDVLLVDLSAPKIDADAFQRQYALEPLPLTGAYFSDRSQEIGMAEAMVGADSDLVGKTVVEADVRDRFNLSVIGLRRGQAALAGSLRDEPLRIGDTLLVAGPWKAIERLRREQADLLLLNLPAEVEEVLPVRGRAVPALLCLVLMVALMVSGVVANVVAALIACLLLGAFGCIDLDTAYRSIHWKTLILIIGMLPFSIALQKTGGVELAADGLMALTSGAGTYGVLAALFTITAMLGLFISNTATAVLMAPVALAMAHDLGASPYPFAMIVALAASAAFMTPISSPVNTLVVAPGDYSFGDFVKVGVPFSLVVLVVSVLLVPWLLPL
jgi:di/tricarboxylate transporter